MLGLKIADKGTLVGRVLREAMPGGTDAAGQDADHALGAGAGGLRTVLRYQTVGSDPLFRHRRLPGPHCWTGEITIMLSPGSGG